MNRLFSNVSAACLLALTAALAVGGCAGLNALPPPIEDIAPQREERKQEVVEDFEQRRDESQYQAALAAWERGDTRGCEEQLVQLLRRNPNHHTARQALADLYLEGENFPAAEKHYRQLIQDQPGTPRLATAWDCCWNCKAATKRPSNNSHRPRNWNRRIPCSRPTKGRPSRCPGRLPICRTDARTPPPPPPNRGPSPVRPKPHAVPRKRCARPHNCYRPDNRRPPCGWPARRPTGIPTTSA